MTASFLILTFTFTRAILSFPYRFAMFIFCFKHHSRFSFKSFLYFYLNTISQSVTHSLTHSLIQSIFLSFYPFLIRQGKELDAFGTAGPRSSTPTLLSDLSVERNGNRNSRGADGVTDEERDKERVKKVLKHSYIVFTSPFICIHSEFLSLLRFCVVSFIFQSHPHSL